MPLPVHAPDAVLSVLFGFGAAGLQACGGNAGADITPASDFEREVTTVCGGQPIGDGLNADQAAALREGRAHFEPAPAARCLTWLESNGCARGGAPGTIQFLELRLPGLCRDAYSGTLAFDESCEQDIECTDDAYCEALSDNPPSAQCTPRVPTGAPCFNARQCSVMGEQVPNCVPDESGTPRCVAE